MVQLERSLWEGASLRPLSEVSQAHSGAGGKVRPRLICWLKVRLEAGQSNGYSPGCRPLVSAPYASCL